MVTYTGSTPSSARVRVTNLPNGSSPVRLTSARVAQPGDRDGDVAGAPPEELAEGLDVLEALPVCMG